ncbi:copper chaperone PCu(A)C [Pseudoruegeria sp. SHC-113]|uniref:copper chaperone PCu(A)C n=1 Tax=Pseudoruegeria sp. SHC-113 TaxID=2855439 RepID=UPI0021BA602E|nr:copper chaperone PCu(A)C [Pseudoruegeria sp. SHC-113]MCT8161513.1 copper chaperone PCu(A)C [Pseudoruegeria sp. SHC-113]
MSFAKTLLAASTAVLLAVPAFAADATIEVRDAYARAAGATAKAGAAFMEIANTGEAADRLIDARSDAAAKVELHTHKDMGDGVMKMMHVEEGFEVPAGGMVMLERGGNHVMFMGLTAPFEQGKMLDVTLVFENAGEIAVQIPVDNEREAAHGTHKH